MTSSCEDTVKSGLILNGLEDIQKALRYNKAKERGKERSDLGAHEKAPGKLLGQGRKLNRKLFGTL